MKAFDRAGTATANSAMHMQGVLDTGYTTTAAEPMTLNGTITKTLILFGLMAVGVVVGILNASSTLMYVGLFGGLGLAMATIFKPQWSPYTGPLYAFVEGLFLGIISMVYAGLFDGIVLQAVGLTMATFAVMLITYRTGLIKVTDKFRSIIIAATGGILLMYIVAFVMNFFFGISPTYLHESSWLSIGLSLLIIGVAAMNLLLDFDIIERGVAAKAPKYMEWFGGVALIITLVWLYLEFLRLLALLSSD